MAKQSAKLSPIEKLKQYRKANVPLLIFGGPGIGKSEICKAAAEGDEVKDVRLSMLEPVDLRGLPLPGNRDSATPTVAWARPDFLPKEGKGIILFDELNTADPAVQNAALQFILDRRCGPHVLGKDWWIVACGNKASHKAHVNPLSAPLRNRFVILELEAEYEHWMNWALANSINPLVTGFMAFTKGEHLYKDPEGSEYSNFPTPRAWSRVSQLLNHNINGSDDLEGCVGKAAATLLASYIKETSKLPDIDDIIEGKAQFSDGSGMLSLTYGLVSGILHRTVKDAEITDKAVGALTRCSVRPEIAAIFFGGLLVQKDPTPYIREIGKSAQAKTWMTTHKQLLMPFQVDGRATTNAK